MILKLFVTLKFHLRIKKFLNLKNPLLSKYKRRTISLPKLYIKLINFKLYMSRLNEVSDIWVEEANEEDIESAIKYSTISLPWTFDRMGYGGRSQNGVNYRLLNILKGVLAQNILSRVLDRKGFDISKDWTQYREEDLFDFQIKDLHCDVKTVQIYSEYDEDVNRREFSPEFLIENRDYEGKDWRRLFPMMLSHRQLSVIKDKDLLIYGISHTSKDFRKSDPDNIDGGYWVTGPCKDAFHFFQNPIAIKKREEAKEGFNVKTYLKRTQDTIEEQEPLKVTLIGEWDGHKETEQFELNPGCRYTSKNEFSSLCAVELDHPGSLLESDELIITASTNYNGKIRKPTDPSRNLNNDNFQWELGKSDFVNLLVPDDYTIYWLGFISREEFFNRFQNYTGYFIPKGDNMDENQLAEAQEDDKKSFKRLDERREKNIENGEDIYRPKMMDLIDDEGNIDAGFMMAKYRGPKPIGGACYFYPPYAIRESALYVLPKDLRVMDELKSEIS